VCQVIKGKKGLRNRHKRFRKPRQFGKQGRGQNSLKQVKWDRKKKDSTFIKSRGKSNRGIKKKASSKNWERKEPITEL